MNRNVTQGHRARKRFGQNFLNDQYIIDQIVAAIAPKTGENLVEIGPGLGAITEPVSQMTDHLNVVELDRDLAERLESHPQMADKLTIHQADALKFDFSQLVKADGNKLKVFGNLPYNISTPLLFHLFEYADHIESMHFMLQKEVVKRMTADPGSKAFGRLTVMTQYFCQTLPVVEVPPECFDPPPKVDSAVIRLIPHPASARRVNDIKKLNQVCLEAFNQRRKTLRNSLKNIIDASQIESLGIDSSLRPENLTLDNFITLANFIEKNGQNSV